MRKTRITATLAALFSALMQSSAMACSPLPNDSNTSTDVPPRYDFVASVVDEELAADPNQPGKTIIASLRFRVQQSVGTEPAAGTVVAMGYQYTGAVTSTCARQTRPLTLRDWRAGTRVRIRSNDLYSAESIHTAD
uniref:hypothetical protein n=1 Tax=unclassified Variovorax TaxID=663243 RepID=UPI000D38CF62